MTGGHWLVASGNPGKLKELRVMLAPRGVRLSSQTELGIPDAEEPWPSFVENALAGLHIQRQQGQGEGIGLTQIGRASCRERV